MFVVLQTHLIHHAFDVTDAAKSENATKLTQSISLKKGVLPLTIAATDPFRASGVWAYTAKNHPLPAMYKQPLRDVKIQAAKANSPARLRPVAATALEKLFEKANSQGRKLIALSSYRSLATQQQVFDESLSIRGAKQTRNYIAVPGTSEHHTGLAADIDSYSTSCLNNSAVCAINDSDAAWLEEHAPDFGFIIRYPLGKEKITGYNYEPWHLRFVGAGARQLADSGLTLDELVKKVEK